MGLFLRERRQSRPGSPLNALCAIAGDVVAVRVAMPTALKAFKISHNIAVRRSLVTITCAHARAHTRLDVMVTSDTHTSNYYDLTPTLRDEVAPPA